MQHDLAYLSPQFAWILLVIFGALWIGLSWYWGFKNRNFEDHALAGRNIGLALASATSVATWITSNTTMLAPQFALQMGVWGMLAYSSAAFGLFLFAPLAERIRLLMPNGYTVGDFFWQRYGKVTWTVFLIFTLFYSMVWLASMAMAGGIILNVISGIKYQYGMTVILLVCVIYTVRGGLYAVIGTDFIQSFIIILGVLAIGIYVINKISISAIYESLYTQKPALLSLVYPVAIINFFNNLLFGMGEVFHNNIWWSRAFAFRKGIAKRAFFIAGLIWLPIPIAAGFIALASTTLGLSVPSADMVGPLVIVSVLGKSGAIIIFIIIFCSLSSSIDSLLAATSDLFSKDIYFKLINPKASPEKLKKAAQYVTIMMGIITWLVCLPRPGTILTILFLSGPIVGSMIWPIITGLYWKRASSMAATMGMLFGSISGLIAYFKIGWYTGGLVGTFVSMLCVIFYTAYYPADYDWHQLKKEI